MNPGAVVLSRTGAAVAADFNNATGAPIVGDTDTGVMYWLGKGGNPFPITFGSVYVDGVGALADGSDDTAAFVLAVASIATAGVIYLTPGKNYKVSTVPCDGKVLTFFGYGATITYTSAAGAFSKTDHGFKLTVFGITFVPSGAASIAIKYNATPTVNTYDDYLIRDCDFSNATNGYAVSLVGPREGNVQRCTFRGNASGGGGIYLQNAVSPFVESCQFIGGGAGKGVFYDGIGLGFDAGLVLTNSEIMGWDTDVDIRYCDWLKIAGCTIDYGITANLVIYSQDGGVIEGNYLGSNTTAPALQLSKGVLGVAPDFCSKITITDNHFTGHYTGGNTYDNILINDNNCSDIIIENNHIDFWTRYGINFQTLADILIIGNTFSPRPTFGVLPIFNSTGTGDSRVSIRDNNFPAGTTFAGSGLAFCTMRDNFGYLTNRESAYVTSGAGTTYNVPHGMQTTPDSVQLTASAAGARPLWVTGTDATNISIATDAVYAAFTVYWTAVKGQGF